MDSSYNQITLLLFATALIGLFALRLRQPIIVAYILVGILAGPSVLNWVSAHEPMELLAEIGVTILLFVVGLKLDIKLVRQLGPVALATGLGQLLFTIVFGFLICAALGMDWVRALYIAVALTFSSTIIIVKLLSDKREIDSLHGRIAMGFLIVQDVAVVLAMMVIGSQGAVGVDAAAAGVWLQLVQVFAKVAGLGVVVFLLMRYVLPGLLRAMAGSQELLLVFAVGWGASLAAGGEWLGFSKEVGAFLAGFSLASLPFREAINARLASLRDFLLLFFFVQLGTQMDLGSLGAEMLSATVLSLFVLVGNPLIVLAIMGFMGYRKRTGFLAGLTVAQISEFSIIFVAMGVALGQVDAAALGLVTLVGLVTITSSTYMILYSQKLFAWCEPWLGWAERKDPFRERALESPPEPSDVIVFGMGRYGRRLAERLNGEGVRVLGVDFDPELQARFAGSAVPVLFGDAADAEFVTHLPLGGVRVVVSTLRDMETDLGLMAALRRQGFTGTVAATVHSARDGERLQAAGADQILMPFTDAADHAARRIAAALGEGERR
ncbi:cation:proton antiporter [Pseudoxanthomonas wuyuanensis]|uniref:Transporter, CPA2 family n=1 Tax=Pseudoxanthomonas wuyuanensis TaxID=1073196 RepID=A0A286D7E2_9GAMM|nr:cation:proton antiporter family protein [Pseudoxanthomonas wuyuanensis]KAF1719043.1 sodium:proton exchanger [Pseudoxanthomonas wuyuanensis]SOD54583.1 transporter, CPA2 family [Pseudoxanthomonas wuyuanensis]